jgi:hypothetical protein
MKLNNGLCALCALCVTMYRRPRTEGKEKMSTILRIVGYPYFSLYSLGDNFLNSFRIFESESKASLREIQNEILSDSGNKQ